MAMFTVPADFAREVNERLVALGVPGSVRRDSLALLALLAASLRPQSFSSRIDRAELAELSDLGLAGIKAPLAALVAAGAVGTVGHQGARTLGLLPPGMRQGKPRLRDHATEALMARMGTGGGLSRPR